jgi:hypothetical protein
MNGIDTFTRLEQIYNDELGINKIVIINKNGMIEQNL